MDGKVLFSEHLVFDPEQKSIIKRLDKASIGFEYTKMDYDRHWYSKGTKYAAAINLPKYVVVVVEELPKIEPTSSHQGIYFVIKLSRLLRLLH